MTNKKGLKNTKNSLDRFSGTKPSKKRGRPRKIPREWVTGRASNYEFQLGQVWEKLEPSLLQAKTADEVTESFANFAQPYASEFVQRHSSDIFLLLKDPDFPKRAEPRVKFLARSLAGRTQYSFRSSRDICDESAIQEERKSPHRILRREFFIECSCGYKGPALDNDCPGCGAQPQLSLDNWTGRSPEVLEVKTREKIRKTAQPELLHQEVAAAVDPNSVQCERGATISASSREIALEALAKHRHDEHGEIANQRTEEPAE